jgi:hypothetical protein
MEKQRPTEDRAQPDRGRWLSFTLVLLAAVGVGVAAVLGQRQLRGWWVSAVVGVSAAVALLAQVFSQPLTAALRRGRGYAPSHSLTAHLLDQTAPPGAASLAAARQALLAQVRRIWITGFLDHSLAQVTRIQIGLTKRPETVAPPWGLVIRHPGQPDAPIPIGTSLDEVAAQAGGHLLVLGAPGSGKTTLLLEHARTLLDHADSALAATSMCVPVVFHLSSWTATPPVTRPGRRAKQPEWPTLADWLADELRLRYDLPRQIARTLVEQDQLAPLLDGLDEIPAGPGREACVTAINAYRAEHGLTPLVVCSRTTDYEELTSTLAFDTAVEIQPLPPERIRDWLRAAGRPLAGVRAALRDDPQLWELLTTPLVLNLVALAYHGQPAAAVRAQGDLAARRQRLMADYVSRMLSLPRAPVAPDRERTDYAPRDTVRWLAWLARHRRTVLYPDQFLADIILSDQPPSDAHIWLNGGLKLVVGVASGLIFALASTLLDALDARLAFALFFGAYLSRLRFIEPRSEAPPREPPLFMITFNPIGAIIIGLAVGLAVGQTRGWIVGLVAGLIAWYLSLYKTIASLVALLVFCLAVGLMGGLIVWLAYLLSLALFLRLELYLRHRLGIVLMRGFRLIPPNLPDFLEYCDSRILLRRAGGGYLFVHGLVQDYFGVLPLAGSPSEEAELPSP